KTAMKFDDYPIAAAIKKNLAAAGYKRPTDIQFKAIPSILNGEDVLAVAQTGTGKTAAFAIPVIDRIHKSKRSGSPPGIRCIVMVPTRELAGQIGAVFNTLSSHTRVHPFAVYGGVDQDRQIARLKDGIDILVATPGRMFDLISQGAITLTRVNTLVLDEADRMLAKGFFEDIQAIKKKLPQRHQTLFFSATIDKEIKKLAFSQVKTSAIRIQISPDSPVSKNVTHWVVEMEMDDKRFFLRRFVRDHETGRILVFVRTKVRAERVAKALERAEIAAVTIHGDKDQMARNQVMARFKAGEERILIATDVSARGIDIPELDYVINYDLPEDPENYVHRVGRTGRGTRKGQAFSFCSPEEKPLLNQIQTLINQDILIQPVTPQEYAQILLDPKDTDGLRQMILAHEAKGKSQKKPRKKSKKS
ncbi:MAG TPA: DEAD/DEAH box helicase, partial [Desulfotignum sp.]|nr:DEAD/DEAH box helicase [Desulfotignum sp.]